MYRCILKGDSLIKAMTIKTSNIILGFVADAS